MSLDILYQWNLSLILDKVLSVPWCPADRNSWQSSITVSRIFSGIYNLVFKDSDIGRKCPNYNNIRGRWNSLPGFHHGWYWTDPVGGPQSLVMSLDMLYQWNLSLIFVNVLSVPWCPAEGNSWQSSITVSRNFITISEDDGIVFQGFTMDDIGQTQWEDPNLWLILNFLKNQVEPEGNELFLSSPGTRPHKLIRRFVCLLTCYTNETYP
jgi:hypothetical protein